MDTITTENLAPHMDGIQSKSLWKNDQGNLGVTIEGCDFLILYNGQKININYWVSKFEEKAIIDDDDVVQRLIKIYQGK